MPWPTASLWAMTPLWSATNLKSTAAIGFPSMTRPLELKSALRFVTTIPARLPSSRRWPMTRQRSNCARRSERSRPARRRCSIRTIWLSVAGGSRADAAVDLADNHNRVFHAPSNFLLTPWLQPGEECDAVAINCFNSLRPCEKAVETARPASGSQSTGLKPRC